MLKLFLVLFLVSLVNVNAKRPIVEISNGKIRGEIMFTPNNRSFYAFRGIPYAKPPLGDLRFQPPQRLDDWKGVLDSDAKDRMCVQTTSNLMPNESEDCLYVHVYTPKLPTKKQKVSLPVMYVIHGGAFVLGTPTPAMLGPHYLMDYDIVIVSVGYRLGFLGFLATEDLNCPGNNGFKDQQFGLRWVQENIHKFGGDRRRVTIFGESAGAASVGYQLLGSNAKGLFNGAIMNSGSSLVNWSLQRNPKKIAYRFAKHIDPKIDENNTSTSELMKFFRTLKVQTIKTACTELFGEGLLSLHYRTLAGFLFAGTIEPEHEGAFLTKAPYQMLLKGDFNVVPTMLGVTSEESLFLGNDLTMEGRMVHYNKNPEHLVLPSMHVTDPDSIKKAGQTIKDLYEPSGSLDLSRALSIKYFSDTTFDRPVMKQAEMQSKYTDVFLYMFGYSGEMGKNSLSSHVPGAEKVVHAEDMMYLFSSVESKDIYSFRSQDRKTMKRMLTLWSNFVKYRNPTPKRLEILENVIWPRIRSLDMIPYLHINDTLKVKHNYKKKMMDVYKHLYDTYAEQSLDVY